MYIINGGGTGAVFAVSELQACTDPVVPQFGTCSRSLLADLNKVNKFVFTKLRSVATTMYIMYIGNNDALTSDLPAPGKT